MAIYQVKLKGKEDLYKYRTFVARDVGDTIKQATEKNKVTIEAIEVVNLVVGEDDIDHVVDKLKVKQNPLV